MDLYNLNQESIDGGRVKKKKKTTVELIVEVLSVGVG